MMSGLNSYDYGARQYYSVVPAFDRIDRYAEKYYNLSPYSYCGGNPVNAVDIKGDSIAPLQAPHGARSMGHMAALVQHDDGKWYYYSSNGTKDHGAKGPQENPDRGTGPFDSVEEFMQNYICNWDNERNEVEYTEAYVIPATKEQDAAAVDAMSKELQKDYDVTLIDGTNCAKTVQEGLKAAGLNDGSVFNPGISGIVNIVNNRVPNIIYQNIKKQNPGKVIKYHK